MDNVCVSPYFCPVKAKTPFSSFTACCDVLRASSIPVLKKDDDAILIRLMV